MSTIETDVDGENPSARIRGHWVDAPMREELQAFLDGVNGLANNASSAAQQATVAASEASADKVIVLGKAAEVATSLEETKAIANNVANSAIAIEQAKQTASQAAASAGTSALSADNSATAATTQANKAKTEADRAQSIVDNFNPGSDGGGITISTLPPEGIPKEGQQWIMIGDVD